MMPRHDFVAIWEQAGRHDRDELLRARLRFDLEGFARWLWPDRFDLPFNALHASLFAPSLTRAPWDERVEDELSATAAPRGYAKSTICSFVRVAHAIVYDLEAYIVLCSSEMRLAVSLSRDLKAAFEDKDGEFARLYGPFVVSGGVGEWTVSVAGRPSVGVLARGVATAIRGAKHPTRGIRPTLAVLDDVEDRIRVHSPTQRESWWSWLVKDVLKLGRRQGGLAVEVIGTTLHPDSVLSRLLKQAGWKAARWQAILSWPERPDLWERCRAVWCDLTLGTKRERAARLFYEAHRAEMDRGVKVLDPGVEDIFRLYTQIWAGGLASFLSEKQNDPIDPSAAIFDVERFRWFTVEDHPVKGPVIVTDTGRRVPVSELTLWGRWDPSAGDPTGDYAAIAIVGRDRHGYTYVLDVWMRKAKPSAQVAAAWALAERWAAGRSLRMSLESNGFQDLVAEPLLRERKERQEQGRFWKLQVEPEPSTTDKTLRIASMEPDTANGWLMFNRRLPPDVVQQAVEFPTGAHDDGIDAIHGAWHASGGAPPAMGQTRLE